MENTTESSSPAVPVDETLDRLMEEYWRDSRVGTFGEVRLAQEAIRRHVAQAIASAVRTEREIVQAELRKRMRSDDDARRFPVDHGMNVALEDVSRWLDLRSRSTATGEAKA